MEQPDVSDALREVLACRESLQKLLLRVGSRSKVVANIKYSIRQLDGLIAMLRDTSKATKAQ